ncbi:MAG: HdeD family acid-resistance protein [Bryobacteraceae bacterium]|jgi:uncharacterized membrane protein HdeD (DUF308 family)
MTKVLAQNWWALALRGAVAVIFGLIAFFIPQVTLYALTILFGAYALIDGIVSLGAAIHVGRSGERWWGLVFEGIVGLLAAAFTLIWPAITLLILIYIIAGWAVVTGVFEIVAAIQLRRHIAGEWLLILAGAASILFGVLLFAAPGPGAIVLAWWIGAYIFIFGLLMIGLAFRLRRAPGLLNPQEA